MFCCGLICVVLFWFALSAFVFRYAWLRVVLSCCLCHVFVLIAFVCARFVYVLLWLDLCFGLVCSCLC